MIFLRVVNLVCNLPLGLRPLEMFIKVDKVFERKSKKAPLYMMGPRGRLQTRFTTRPNVGYPP